MCVYHDSIHNSLPGSHYMIDKLFLKMEGVKLAASQLKI